MELLLDGLLELERLELGGFSPVQPAVKRTNAAAKITASVFIISLQSFFRIDDSMPQDNADTQSLFTECFQRNLLTSTAPDGII